MTNIESSRRPAPLHGIFTEVPPRYDIVNRVITLGLDNGWRKIAARACLERNPQRILDLGCGTGDLSISIARLAGKIIEITGIDFSLPMLERAREKAKKTRVADSVKYINAEATNLPFPDGYFDCVGISFAFRNLTYKNPLCFPHLYEVKRVLKSDGRYVIVESSQPQNGIIRMFFHIYLRLFVKPLGIILSGNRGAYSYLTESAAHYYMPQEVREMLLKAGFCEVSYRPLFFGAAGIHVALK